MAAFAVPEDINIGGRPLNSTQTADAQLMLEAAADWIRERRPDIDEQDAKAKLVSIHVVRTALMTSQYAGLSTFSKTVGGITRSGTLSNPGELLDFTDFHKELLGISFRAGPRWHFERGDY